MDEIEQAITAIVADHVAFCDKKGYPLEAGVDGLAEAFEDTVIESPIVAAVAEEIARRVLALSAQRKAQTKLEGV